MPRSIVRDVHLDEVSFCHEGIHKGARVALIKAKGPPAPGHAAQLERFAPAMGEDLAAAIRKGLAIASQAIATSQLHSAGVRVLDELEKAECLYEPPTFDENEARRVAEKAADELRERMGSLRCALLDVVYMPDLPDREARIKESIDQFVAAMEADLAALLQGRLAKQHLPRSNQQEGPMPAKLDKSKLPDDAKAHVEEIEARLAKAETDLAKAQSDTKAATERAEKAEGERDELRKAKAVDPESDEGFAELIKSLPPAQAEVMKAQRAENRRLAGEVAAMSKATRTTTFLAKAKGYTHLPGKPEELGDVLEKADAAGILAPVETALKAADAALEKAGLTKPVGSDEGGGNADETLAAVEAAAGELQKADPKLTKPQAIAKAIQANPALYKAYNDAHGTRRADSE